MTDRRQRQPASDQAPHAIPKDAAILAASRHLPALTHLVFFLSPTVLAGCLPQSISIADVSVS